MNAKKIAECPNLLPQIILSMQRFPDFRWLQEVGLFLFANLFKFGFFEFKDQILPIVKQAVTRFPDEYDIRSFGEEISEIYSKQMKE